MLAFREEDFRIQNIFGIHIDFSAALEGGFYLRPNKQKSLVGDP